MDRWFNWLLSGVTRGGRGTALAVGVGAAVGVGTVAYLAATRFARDDAPSNDETPNRHTPTNERERLDDTDDDDAAIADDVLTASVDDEDEAAYSESGDEQMEALGAPSAVEAMTETLTNVAMAAAAPATDFAQSLEPGQIALLIVLLVTILALYLVQMLTAALGWEVAHAAAGFGGTPSAFGWTTTGFLLAAAAAGIGEGSHGGGTGRSWRDNLGAYLPGPVSSALGWNIAVSDAGAGGSMRPARFAEPASAAKALYRAIDYSPQHQPFQPLSGPVARSSQRTEAPSRADADRTTRCANREPPLFAHVSTPVRGKGGSHVAPDSDQTLAMASPRTPGTASRAALVSSATQTVDPGTSDVDGGPGRLVMVSPGVSARTASRTDDADSSSDAAHVENNGTLRAQNITESTIELSDFPANFDERLRAYIAASDRALHAKSYRDCEALLSTATRAIEAAPLAHGSDPAVLFTVSQLDGLMPPLSVDAAVPLQIPGAINAIPPQRQRLLAALLWRRGRYLNTIAPVPDLIPAGSSKAEAYRRGLADVQASLELFEGDPEAHKFAGILLSRAAKDTKEKIANGFKIKEHAEVRVGPALRRRITVRVGVWQRGAISNSSNFLPSLPRTPAASGGSQPVRPRAAPYTGRVVLRGCVPGLGQQAACEGILRRAALKLISGVTRAPVACR